MSSPFGLGSSGAGSNQFPGNNGWWPPNFGTQPDQGGGFNIDPFNPPDMKTLVYAPDVRVIIAHGNQQFDVSRDIVRGTVIRKENSASTAFLTLANKDGRYNDKFSRMDRIVIFMRRIRWQQVFSGYLDTVPYRQLYSGAVELKATCTLKRLLHTQWNPSLALAKQLFDQWRWVGDSQRGDGQATSGLDTGLGNILQELLVRVGKWDLSNIHIQNFPTNFLSFMKGELLQNQAANKEQVRKFQQLLLGTSAGLAPPGAYAGASSAAGQPGPTVTGGTQGYLTEIIAACDAAGLGPVAQDLQNSQNLAEAAVQGEKDRNDNTAWAQQQLMAESWRQSTNKNDAAILGVACAAVETGGGAAILNLANASVPDSLKFPNDGLGTNGTSVGVFQQTNESHWGTVSQRMNPRQAASMFFRDLAEHDWRNMEPGAAIQAVQGSSFPAKYSAAVQWATQQVQAYRQAQQGAAGGGAIPIPGLGAVSSLGSAAGLSPTSIATAATSTPMTPGGVRSAAMGKPNPDSEGAINFIMTQLGKPYGWGQTGPASYDCSGLFVAAFRSIGVEIPHYTGAQANAGQHINPANIQRGDLIVHETGTATNSHVVMYLGPGLIVQSGGSGPGGVAMGPMASAGFDLAGATITRIVPNGGVDPSAPFNPLGYSAGPGQPAGVSGSSASGTGAGAAATAVNNLFTIMFDPGYFSDDTAELFTQDHKEFINSQPLIQMVQNLSRSGLRNFASGPDGSFMAYYPDYFGLDGKPAVVQLEDIELKNVSINFSDDNLTTHVYVNGYPTPVIDSGWNPVQGWLDTAGSVTVEHDWLFQRLSRIAPAIEERSGAAMLRRFGVRPYQTMATMAGSHELEFLLACQIFMEKWAQQFQSAVSFTFMPELFPGMRVVLKNHNLQVYVSEVTHTFDFEHGFTTSAVIMAPSRPGGTGQMGGVGGQLGDLNNTSIFNGLGFNAPGMGSVGGMG